MSKDTRDCLEEKMSNINHGLKALWRTNVTEMQLWKTCRDQNDVESHAAQKFLDNSLLSSQDLLHQLTCFSRLHPDKINLETYPSMDRQNLCLNNWSAKVSRDFDGCVCLHKDAKQYRDSMTS